MSIERSYLLVGVILGITILAFGSFDSVYAVDFILLDEASCKDLRGQGQNEMWDGTTSTCTKDSNLNILVGDTLLIPNGVTLVLASNDNIRNDGIITNNGIINFIGGNINNRDAGGANIATFTNSGTILLESISGNSARLTNQNSATFTNTISGSITLDGLAGNNNNRAQLRNQDDADFINSGTITIEGTANNSGQIRNEDTADFKNSGMITIIGVSTNSGQLRNDDTADFTNSGTITIEGSADNSGRIFNRDSSTLTNSGLIDVKGDIEESGSIYNQDSAIIENSDTITIDGTSGNSGQLRNEDTAGITNSGKIILTGVNAGIGDVSGLVLNLSILINSGTFTTNYNFDNSDPNSDVTNSGSIEITGDLDNTGGIIFNDCGEITFTSFSGNLIQEETYCPISLSSNAYEDPTIGKSLDGKQVVENGICIDIRCWTVTAHYHQDFDLVEMLSDSTHTISTTVFCQHGVNKCNYVAFGVSPYGTNIIYSVWKIILQKDHLDNWTMKIIDPDGYLGEVTSTTQTVNDNRYLSASATIEFKKPTPGMILNIEVRDSGGGYRDFKFNDGVAIVDAYAYPSIETSYEPSLEIKPLCHNENSNKRYTCAFEKIKDWTIKNAESTLEQINK